MKNLTKYLIMLGIAAMLGFAAAACDGRVSATYFNLASASALCFSATYFFGADVCRNTLESLAFCGLGMGLPVLIWAVLVRSGDYFGYSAGKLLGGALVCGGILFVMSLLTRHEVGPLRAALGRNMLPAFFAAAGIHRFSLYYEAAGSFSISMSDPLCFAGVFLIAAALAVFIGANRSALGSANTYLAFFMWGGVFAAVLLTGKWLEKDLLPILCY